jgi:hypothetical protein
MVDPTTMLAMEKPFATEAPVRRDLSLSRSFSRQASSGSGHSGVGAVADAQSGDEAKRLRRPAAMDEQPIALSATIAQPAVSHKRRSMKLSLPFVSLPRR